jgi:hypothetical protein
VESFTFHFRVKIRSLSPLIVEWQIANYLIWASVGISLLWCLLTCICIWLSLHCTRTNGIWSKVFLRLMHFERELNNVFP